MTTSSFWSHKIDGTELNDYTNYACEVPEADHYFGPEALLTDMQARTPVFNRQQPVAGKYTFLITVIASSDASYRTKLAALKALFAPGSHTYSQTPPGASSAVTATVYADGGLTVEDEFGRCTARVVAPNPTFS